jgi:phenylacetate-CoA ligase
MVIEQLCGRVLIQAFESGVKRRRTFAYWRDLERSQWASPDELRAGQMASLRKLLLHAASACPYYRDAWQHLGLDPRRVISLDDFKGWPLIGRDAIRAARTAIRADLPGMRLIKKATGGSSGVPLEFELDEDSHDRRMAAAYRGYGWAGGGPGTSQWHLWGGPIGTVSPLRRVKDAAYNRLYRRRVASSFEMSEERIPWYLEQLNRYRPDVIVAYTNPLYYLARSLEERGQRPFAPRSVVVGAEKLHDFQRTLIERVFRAPVFETYGSREFMLIGGECDRHSGLHLTMEHLLVEVVDDEGRPTPEGLEGNVAITDLTNYGMPFIRYLNGDRAVAGFGSCTCGRGLPLLKKVTGRRLDMLETADGRLIPGEFFPHLIKEFPAIRRFQVVQESSGAIQLRVVVNSSWSPDVQSTLEKRVRDTVGAAAPFDLSVVDDIPLTPAGKLQVVVRCRKEATQLEATTE